MGPKSGGSSIDRSAMPTQICNSKETTRAQMGVGLIEPFCTVIDASNTLTNVHFNIVTEDRKFHFLE